MGYIERMKTRWGVGLWGVVAILAAFSLAGMTVVRLRRPILGALLPADAPTWVWWATYLAIIVPLYQVCLLSYGTIFGQFGFFWKKEKAMARFLFGWTRRLFAVAIVGLASLSGVLGATGADAAVVESTPNGFAIEQQVRLPVAPEACVVKFNVDATGNVKEGWPDTVDRVWNHFLAEQLEPYVESGNYLERK